MVDTLCVEGEEVKLFEGHTLQTSGPGPEAGQFSSNNRFGNELFYKIMSEKPQTVQSISTKQAAKAFSACDIFCFQ